MQIKSGINFISGLMFLVIGIGATLIANSYERGTASKMGPGYFPFWLGVLLALLGVMILLNSIRKENPEDEDTYWDFMTLGKVLFSVVLFAFLLESLGLAGSLIVLVMVASFASHEFKWWIAAATALSLTALSIAVFIYGLSLPIPVWPEMMY